MKRNARIDIYRERHIISREGMMQYLSHAINGSLSAKIDDEELLSFIESESIKIANKKSDLSKSVRDWVWATHLTHINNLANSVSLEG